MAKIQSNVFFGILSNGGGGGSVDCDGFFRAGRAVENGFFNTGYISDLNINF